MAAKIEEAASVSIQRAFRRLLILEAAIILAALVGTGVAVAACLEHM